MEVIEKTLPVFFKFYRKITPDRVYDKNSVDALRKW